jgi:hypothetical protein
MQMPAQFAVFPGGHFPGPSLPRVRVRPGDIYYDVAHTQSIRGRCEAFKLDCCLPVRSVCTLVVSKVERSHRGEKRKLGDQR